MVAAGKHQKVKIIVLFLPQRGSRRQNTLGETDITFTFRAKATLAPKSSGRVHLNVYSRGKENTPTRFEMGEAPPLLTAVIT